MFTLGQAGRNIVVRLRTPLSGSNGTWPELRTTDNPLTTDVQHLVVTYGNGIETLYMNGEEHQITALDRTISLYDELDRLVIAE